MLVAAFAVLLYAQRHSQQAPQPAAVRQAVAPQLQQAPATPSLSEQPTFATVHTDAAGSTVTPLENALVSARFTDSGGALLNVAFKRYPAALGSTDPFVFNDLHDSAMLALSGIPGLDASTAFSLVSRTDSEVVFRAVLASGIEITRRYALSPSDSKDSDPYIIRSETTLRNTGKAAAAPMRVLVSLGTAAPSNALDNGLQLTTESWDGKDTTLVRRSELEESGGFVGMGAHPARPVIQTAGPIVWATVKNQFFTAILTPDEPAAGLETRRVKLLDRLPDSDRRAYGISGSVAFDVPSLAPQAEVRLGGSFYVGPKEYPRLSNVDVFKRNQERVMDLGSIVFRFCAAILLRTMTWIHSWAPNWGVAIILTTLALKVFFLPLTVSQSRQSRRMQKIAPELKAVREKYKDNPQKQQTAMMDLYKKHKVNPLGGCLPILVTIPFFIAMYRMLQSAAELRFAHFFWAPDLSAPDTIAVVTLPFLGAIAINVLPVLLCLTAFIQMKATPQPAMDNAQMRMMQFMPLIMLFFYYNFSCALSLYSTVNGLFIIAQQLVVNRMPDIEVPAAEGPGGKVTKNVTPKRR